MATTTHRILVNPDQYTNVSNGNLNCTLINGKNPIRVLVAGEAPNPETGDYVQVRTANVFSVIDLETEDDLWVRAEENEVEIAVIRGAAKIAMVA